MIRDTYAELLTEQIIREILKEGTSPSVSEITQRFNDFVAANDISKPLFIANNYNVSYGTASSVTKYNGANSDIYRDMKVLYKHLLSVSEQSITQFDRWRTESTLLEGRLGELDERINSLLLLSNETAGFFNFLQDNFVDNSKVDLPNSSAYVNVAKGVVSIGTSAAGSTRIDLSTLTDSDVEFTTLSRNNLVSTVSTHGSATRYVVSDISNYWQERIYTNKPGPVSVELKIKLLALKTISRIDVDLHMANQNSTVQLTPMYSTDNYNWKQLAVTNFTRSVVDKTTFQFSPIQAQYIKFIMTKIGFDQVHNQLYAYEFGVDEISFYNEGFAANTESVLISKPLFVNNTSNNPEEFSRIVLEVCEDVPDDTSIDYYITTSNDATVPLIGFTPIDPLGRASSTNPTLLDFGDLDAVIVSGINISYNATATEATDINPSRNYKFITSVSGASAVEQTTIASGVRYSFLNSNDRILDRQVGSGINIAQGTLELWRNVNKQGSSTLVRGIVNGWGFEDPHYKTTVLVGNAVGFSVDFGGKTAIVNGENKSGTVKLAKGKHTIAVHKDNWKLIDKTSVTNLTTLKAADSLYPYNHRYLVEGFEYPTAYPSTEEKLYRGFDIMAQYFMKEVSIFDILNNVPKDGYDRFAKDLDVEDSDRLFGGSPASITSSSTVFVIKVDESNSDFGNEEFMLRFKSANSLFKYLRLKAVLKTTDSNKTPFVDSYRIKISS